MPIQTVSIDPNSLPSLRGNSGNGLNHVSKAPVLEPEAAGEDFWGEDGFTFGDLLDVINPLQHIPVVSMIYRAITGDEASTGARVMGGGLFGGVVGVVASFFDMSVKDATGKDMGEHAVAFFNDDEAPSAAPVQVAGGDGGNADVVEKYDVASAALHSYLEKISAELDTTSLYRNQALQEKIDITV